MHWLHVVIDVPPAQSALAADFWAGALGWPAGPPWSEFPEFRGFAPPAGDPYVLLQVGDHGPRVHIDVEVPDPDAEAERLAALGAQIRPAGRAWRPMRSPGGLPFCLVGRGQHDRPVPPVVWTGGHASRLVQVCLDLPASLADTEVAFWRAALPTWRTDVSDLPEFVGKLVPPPGSPVKLLFQVLGPEDRGTTVRAHLDFGTDDLVAEVARLEALGAHRQWSGGGWVCLRDPLGALFCATENPPD